MDGVGGDGAHVATGPELVESLRRWEDGGAVWKVLSQRGGRVTVGLFRCDGGEEVDRITSDARELVAFVAGRSLHRD